MKPAPKDPARNMLTQIPLENMHGDRLEVCKQCFGSGASSKSLHDYALRTGKTYRQGQSLTEADRRIFWKEKWKFSTARCERCGGAGMAKA